jgi:glutamate-1-semialdehyde 2,1-aminomutase
VPPGAAEDTVVAPLDDEAAVEAVIAQHARDLAAVIVEPLPANFGLLPQRIDWLRGLAEQCHHAGALLIFDEVISGFRVGRGGMAETTGLRPDLVCYGKVIGGGFPVGAYAGRGDLMDHVAPVGPVYQAGTLSANPVGMRAGLAALAKVERLDGWTELDRRTADFTAALATGFARLGAPIDVVREASLFWLRVHADRPVRQVGTIPATQGAWYTRFFHAALRRGVYLPPAAFEVCFLSLAHDPATLAEAVAALGEAAREAMTP